MFNNTLIVVRIKEHRTECVTHYNSDGEIIQEHTYKDANLQCFVTPSDRVIIWVDEDRDAIMQWNLQTGHLLQFEYSMNIERADLHTVFYFPQTQLLCMHEHGRKDNNFFKLSYYKYPLMKDSQPIHCFESEDVWNYEHMVRTANNRSGMIWFKNKMKDEIELNFYEILQKENGQWEGKLLQDKVKNNFKHSGKTVEISVGNVWQLTPYNFFFVTITSIPSPQIQQDFPNGLFVLESENRVFRQAKFSLHGKFRLQFVDYISFGNTSMIRGFDFQDGKAVQSPVYYLNNLEQNIAAVGSWKISHLSKYHVPGYDANCLVQNIHQNGDIQSVTSKLIKISIQPKHMAYLIEGFIDKIDEHLCRQSLQILGYST